MAAVAALMALGACAEAPAPSPRASGPLATHAALVAAAHAVPVDLLLAIGAVEGGLTLPRFREVDGDDEVPVAGIVELRHGAFDSLTEAAALVGRPVDDLRADTDLGTEAAAALLGSRAPSRPTDLAAWGEVVGELSGHRDAARRADYVARVFRVLRAGGTFTARDGEQVVIAPHAGIDVALTLSPPRLGLMGTPESSLVTEWVETPKSGGNGSCTNKWNDDHAEKNYVAIHDTEGGWDASLATLQNDGCKSVQYMVDKDGSRVAQFLPEKITAFHLGNYFYNQRTIGIEHVGKASETYAASLYEVSAALVKDITKRHGIPVDRQHIWGHYQVPDGSQITDSSPVCALGLSACEKSPDYGGASNHRDPGLNWQWCQYMERLGGSCECNDAWSKWNCTTDLTQAWRCNGGTKLEKQECTAGCVIQPVGTEDLCQVAGGTGGAAGSDGGGGSAGEPVAGASSEAGAGGTGAAGAEAGGASGSGANAGSGTAGAAGGPAGATGGAGKGGSPGPGVSGSSGQGGVSGPVRIDLGNPSSDGGCAVAVAGANEGARALTAAGIALALRAARRRRRSQP